MIIEQHRFTTRGDETRLQPERQKADFRRLLDYESRLEVHIENLYSEVIPATYREIKRRPETALLYPQIDGDLWCIKNVDLFKVSL